MTKIARLRTSLISAQRKTHAAQTVPVARAWVAQADKIRAQLDAAIDGELTSVGSVEIW